MNEFKDTSGNRWTIDLPIGTVLRVKAESDGRLNLLDPQHENLADRIAPLDAFTYGAINYNPMHSSGAIGRYFTVGVKYTF